MKSIISDSSKPYRPIGRGFSMRLFIAVVWLIGLSLAANAVFTFTTLLRLRSQYLSSRSHEIASAIEVQARGQGRRNNPAFWQQLLDERYQTYSSSVGFLALVDKAGEVLAGRGAPGLEATAFSRGSSDDIYVFDLPLSPPRVPFGGMSPLIMGWQLRVGLYSSDAGFIRRQAFLHLAVSCAAIAALAFLSFYLLQIIRGFLALKTREAAEAHLRSLGTMSAALAHEIRNPLGAMKGLTQLAQEDLPQDHNAQVRLRTVISEAERLERLVSDLLDFARPKDPEISEFDLTELILEVQSMLQPRLESAGITLQLPSVDSHFSTRSDPAGLRQVLLNVLFNAAEATPRGGTIILQTRRDERKGTLLLQVDDSGTGLGGRDPEELFQPFVTTRARGTGLGLAVSRQIMERLGGSLTLTDAPQGGARCSILLPSGSAR